LNHEEINNNLFLLVLTFIANAQNHQIIDEEQLWLGYFNKTRLTDEWRIWADIHYRGTEHFV
jgi:hypothetical protein